MTVTNALRHLADRYDVVVVGAGPAGMAAAVGARQQGAQQVLLVGQDTEVGGILLQCIHSGFGLHVFEEEITGPEYAERYLERVCEHEVDVLTDAFVMDVSADRRVKLMSPATGVGVIDAGAVVLATGARERTRAAIHIPGDRPAGVLTAGLAQQMVNLHGYLPGRRVVILGSGDIGLIMARRLTLEGAEVIGVYELMDHPNGLGRNLVQCLEDFDIPLHLSTTVVEVHGRYRVEKVTVAPVDDDLRPVLAKAWEVPCDTLLLSVGLIPDTELAQRLGLRLDPVTNGPVVASTMETSRRGVYAAGNIVHINDLADWVTREAIVAGRAAGDAVSGREAPPDDLRLLPGDNVASIVPQSITRAGTHTLSLRVRRPIRTDTLLRVGAVHQRKLRAVAPAEMLTVKVSPRLLESVRGETLRIDVVPASEGRGG